ncbi:MAG: hypothetical protein M1826_004493 [Phylliscum demangeonii]|nr:MAG: hypothetical protein M1826_004493 [Phylliscum demangeonii]
MLAPPYFSIPVSRGHGAPTLRASQHQPRKRQRGAADGSDGQRERERERGTESREQSPSSTDGAKRRKARTIVPPPTADGLKINDDDDDGQQFRVAGCARDPPIRVPLHFPHRGLVDRRPARPERGRGHDRERQVEQALAQLRPACYIPGGGGLGARIMTGRASIEPASAQAAVDHSLRHHHLSVLTTVLHRCLLAGDYARAGRTWGLLLRTKFRGKPVDLLAENRWGVGAEILLRRQDGGGGRLEEDEDEDEDDRSQRVRVAPQYTRHGFLHAKEYYERMVLQYPFYYTCAARVNPLDFYPALFSAWIYVAQQERRELMSFGDGDGHGNGHDERPGRNDADRLVLIRQRERVDADAIAARLDELMLAPPYIDRAEFWRLRGMVALWRADLCLSPSSSSAPSTAGPAVDGNDADGGEREKDVVSGKDERALAEATLQRAAALGEMVWPGVEGLRRERMETEMEMDES